MKALLALIAFSACTIAQAGDGWDIQVARNTDKDGWHITVNHSISVGSSANRIAGSGKIVEKARAVSGFNKIRVEGPMNVRLKASDTEGATVKTDDNIEPLVQTRVENGALIIDLPRNASFKTRGPLEVTVNFKTLNAIALSGSGDVSADRLSTDKLEVSVAGSGDIKLDNLQANSVSGNIAGSGDVTLAGTVANQNYSIAGSGDIHAKGLAGKSVKVSIAGSGDASVSASDSLDVSIAGSGDVIYSGNPTVKKSVLGSGSVSKGN